MEKIMKKQITKLRKKAARKEGMNFGSHKNEALVTNKVINNTTNTIHKWLKLYYDISDGE